MARGAASAPLLPRSASIRSSACSAARSRLVASGTSALTHAQTQLQVVQTLAAVRAHPGVAFDSCARARCAGHQEVTVARARVKRRISSAQSLVPVVFGKGPRARRARALS